MNIIATLLLAADSVIDPRILTKTNKQQTNKNKQKTAPCIFHRSKLKSSFDEGNINSGRGLVSHWFQRLPALLPILLGGTP